MPRALLRWAVDESLDIALIDPGKPWQNGTAESFNGKFRDECLSMEWFRNRSKAKVVIKDWQKHYNSVRPRSSLGNMTPAADSRIAQTNTSRDATLKDWVVRRNLAGHLSLIKVSLLNHITYNAGGPREKTDSLHGNISSSASLFLGRNA